MRTWERYFYKEVAKIFFLFLFCFYGLYVLIDFSSRSHAYRAVNISFGELASYYGYIFIQRMEILVPFALMIATIRTLTLLNIRNELVALMAAGVKKSRLMRPFILFALLWVGVIYLNFQFLLPYGSQRLANLEDARFAKKMRGEQKDNLQSVMLKDQSLLLYHSYDSVQEAFFDVLWMRSIDEIYRMQSLFPFSDQPKGTFIDIFKRNPEGLLVLAESYPEKILSEMHFDKKALQTLVVQPSQQSITALWREMQDHSTVMTSRMAAVETQFYHKLLVPWLCLLAVLAPAPFCLRFSRQLPVFFIYLAAMLGMVVFYLLLNAMLILGENQVIEPVWASALPFGAAGLILVLLSII